MSTIKNLGKKLITNPRTGKVASTKTLVGIAAIYAVVYGGLTYLERKSIRELNDSYRDLLEKQDQATKTTED